MIDGDQGDLSSQGAGEEHAGFAQGKNRDINRRSSLIIQPTILKMADDEDIIPLLLSGDGVADDLGRATKFRDAAELEIRRRDAMHLVMGVPIRPPGEGLVQTVKVVDLSLGSTKLWYKTFIGAPSRVLLRQVNG